MAELLHLNKCDPWWVAGFADGEACFYAGIDSRVKSFNGKTAQCTAFVAEFTIALRADDKPILESIQSYFGCGELRRKNASKGPSAAKGAKDQYRFAVRTLDELEGSIIPHFDRYPLQTKKHNDYLLWKEIISFVNDKLRGRKGWQRKYSVEVDKLTSLCEGLSNSRAYRDPDLHSLIGGHS